MLPPEIQAIVKLAGHKVRQHYVFRRYLRPWCSNQRLAMRWDECVEMVGVRDVAVEKYFYKLQPLTDADVTLVRESLLATANEFVRKNAESLIRCFTIPHAVKAVLDTAPEPDPSVSQWIEEQIVNGVEDYHFTIEAGLIPALDDMLDGGAAFYSVPKACYEFLYAICVQYFRTKKMREAIGAVHSPLPGSDMYRVASLYTLVCAMRVADSLYEDRKLHRIVLLENPTVVPFITGDQPVINLHATYGKGVPKELEFYYPLSPTWAMALVKTSTTIPAVLTEDRGETFNQLIVSNSRRQLFSNSIRYLESLVTE